MIKKVLLINILDRKDNKVKTLSIPKESFDRALEYSKLSLFKKIIFRLKKILKK